MQNYLIYSIILALLLSCSKAPMQEELKKKVEQEPIHQLRNYQYDSNSSLLSRVRNTPAFVLDHFKKLDSRDDYSTSVPTKKERETIRKYLLLLPKLTTRVLQKRLIGIYFINNLMGSGLTEWVINSDNKIYTFMVFNPATLKNDLSWWLTYRENTSFKKTNDRITITVQTGKKYNGFLYVLLHEATHAVDYSNKITPYVEEYFKGKQNIHQNVFTRAIWKTYRTPITLYNYPYREKLSFYGFGKGPQIKIEDAPTVYRQLSGTPFVSLYGSSSWAEDLADYLFFYHLVRKLHQPYKIVVRDGNSVLYSVEPMRSERVRSRERAIGIFYR